LAVILPRDFRDDYRHARRADLASGPRKSRIGRFVDGEGQLVLPSGDVFKAEPAVLVDERSEEVLADTAKLGRPCIGFLGLGAKQYGLVERPVDGGFGSTVEDDLADDRPACSADFHLDCLP
jgi:hypothetical protein